MSSGRPGVAWIDEAAEGLAGVTSAPRREAARLLAHALGYERRSDLHHDLRASGGPEVLTPEAHARFRALVAERAAGVPLQYVLGYVDFYECRLAVRRGVFIPRPETEHVVEAALSRLPPNGRILDLGTGTGAIVLSVLGERADARGDAVDISTDAVALARENAAALRLEDRVRLREGDIFDPLPAGVRYDVVAANPPYVATSDALPPDVRDHEPPDALFGGRDGLDVVRRIVSGAPARLATGGWLLVEIGETQGARARELLVARGFEAVRVSRDLAGKDRVVSGRWGGEVAA